MKRKKKRNQNDRSRSKILMLANERARCRFSWRRASLYTDGVPGMINQWDGHVTDWKRSFTHFSHIGYCVDSLHLPNVQFLKSRPLTLSLFQTSDSEKSVQQSRMHFRFVQTFGTPDRNHISHLRPNSRLSQTRNRNSLDSCNPSPARETASTA